MYVYELGYVQWVSQKSRVGVHIQTACLGSGEVRVETWMYSAAYVAVQEASKFGILSEFRFRN